MVSKVFFKNCAICDVWKYIVEPGGLQTVWHMHIACWIPKATKPHSEYVMLTALPLQQWLTYMPQCSLYIHCLSCLFACAISIYIDIITEY